jgi:cell division control protein 7
MSLAQMRAYMKALFEALQHLHVNNVIHRDIKPGNFLYDVKENKFMLVDFGLAQSVWLSLNIFNDQIAI